MEQLRLFIAVVLSFVVFFGWNYFYAKKNPPVEIVQTTQEQAQSGNKSDILNKALAKATTEEKKDIAKILPIEEEKYTVETANYIAVFSSVGAKIESFKLKNYKSENKENSPLKELIDEDFMGGSFFTEFKTLPGTDLKKVNFLSDKSSKYIKVLDKDNLSFEYQTDSGLKIKKEYVFSKDSYLFDCNITIINNTGALFSNQLGFSLNSRKPESKKIGFVGPAVFTNDKLKQIDIKDLAEEGRFSAKLDWGALETIYFLTALVPDSPVEMSTDFKVVGNHLAQDKREYIQADFFTAPFTINNGQKQTFNYHFYLGPKHVEVLNHIGFNLKKSVNFGFFDAISKPCLIVLNAIYKVIPNYGISIILLTLLVKIVFWPLGTKSAKSMDQMKRIQPLMKEIREKYKNDKQRMNQEVMNLYKTYKVNPLSGCLPILVQIPIFFGLYRMLFSAIELRHAPFMMWIQDLSAPDRLLDFSFAIPFMKEPYGIPLLTIIMGASMFLQQKMTPAAGDPAQAKMMMFMPIFITVIFINLPAGLVLYMLVNNIFSMGQQFYVSRSLSK